MQKIAISMQVELAWALHEWWQGRYADSDLYAHLLHGSEVQLGDVRNTKFERHTELPDRWYVRIEAPDVVPYLLHVPEMTDEIRQAMEG